MLCFVVVMYWLIYPYPSGLLHWHCGNLTIAPVPAKQPWWIWVNASCEFIMNDSITTTKQSTTKPCANILGYTVCHQLTKKRPWKYVNHVCEVKPGHYPLRTQWRQKIVTQLLNLIHQWIYFFFIFVLHSCLYHQCRITVERWRLSCDCKFSFQQHGINMANKFGPISLRVFAMSITVTALLVYQQNIIFFASRS